MYTAEQSNGIGIGGKSEEAVSLSPSVRATVQVVMIMIRIGVTAQWCFGRKSRKNVF